MKDLKENIKKNNMKKLVLSVTLGMFCYCTNNAMNPNVEEKEEIKDINYVLRFMLDAQIDIFQAKAAIKIEEGKIYNTIKDQKEGKVQKKKY